MINRNICAVVREKALSSTLSRWYHQTGKCLNQSANINVCFIISISLCNFLGNCIVLDQKFCLVTFGSCSLVLFIHSHCFSEMSPVCAVVGGVLGQEIVKVSK